MIEGSGFGRLKNIRLLRILIRIRNTECSLLTGGLQDSMEVSLEGLHMYNMAL
jgi:hypothetical protein